MRKVKEHNIKLPEEFEGFLLVNHLQLNESETKALLNFTCGSIKFEDIKNWLRKSESKLSASELGSDKKKPTNSILFTERENEEAEEEEDGDEDQEDIATLETYLTRLQDKGEIDGEDYLDENEAAEILHTTLNQKRKTVSFKQSLQKKKEKELGRGYGYQRGPPGAKAFQANFRAKFTIEEVKKRTRRKACNQVGHWHRDAECPKRRGGQAASGHEGHHLETVTETNEAYFLGLLEDGDQMLTPESTTESPMNSDFSIMPFWPRDLTQTLRNRRTRPKSESTTRSVARSL